MGAWGNGPFDNDDAAELLEDIRDGELYLAELLPDAGTRYIEADQGSMIVALAHLAAGDLPEDGDIEASMLADLQTPENKDRLRQGLEAVLSGDTVSELHEMWSEVGEEELLAWKAKSFVDLS